MEKKVLLLLAKGFEAYEASVFTDVLGWSGAETSKKVPVESAGCRLHIDCAWNFRITPDLQLSEVVVNNYAALAIPGGFGSAGFYEDAYQDEFLEIIKKFKLAGKIIASVCVGALPVGKSGILRGKKATTYHLLRDGKRKQLAAFGVNVQDEHLVVDDNIITCSSPAYAVDVAFKLLELLTDENNCKQVRIAMGFEN